MTAKLLKRSSLVFLTGSCLLACSGLRQSDCLNLQAGYNYKTGRPHCCETALWKVDLKNVRLEGTTYTLGGAIHFTGKGLVSLDVKGNKVSSTTENLQELSNVLA